MLNHHCRRNPELQEELQIQAAVAAGDVYTVRKMLEQGYSPKIRDANGWTLLHFSAAKGKERCVRVFLEHGGMRLDVFFTETFTLMVHINNVLITSCHPDSLNYGVLMHKPFVQ